MPLYVYETEPADNRPARRFDVRQGMMEAALTQDPESGLPVRRVITGGLEIPRAPSDARRAPVCNRSHGGGCPCCA